MSKEDTEQIEMEGLTKYQIIYRKYYKPKLESNPEYRKKRNSYNVILM